MEYRSHLQAAMGRAIANVASNERILLAIRHSSGFLPGPER